MPTPQPSKILLSLVGLAASCIGLEDFWDQCSSLDMELLRQSQIIVEFAAQKLEHIILLNSQFVVAVHSLLLTCDLSFDESHSVTLGEECTAYLCCSLACSRSRLNSCAATAARRGPMRAGFRAAMTERVLLRVTRFRRTSDPIVWGEDPILGRWLLRKKQCGLKLNFEYMHQQHFKDAGQARMGARKVEYEQVERNPARRPY
ncbi:hypothetical protein B0H11DRAFT_1935339 [Mycena galericulata]|nr:hypothetical protein B0H11DRAFT_1935339 [Mycena galericulata]